MKLLILLVVVAVAVAAPSDNHYDTKYDNFNVQEVIENQRLLCGYAKCLAGQGNCTPEGNDIKKWLPEATQDSCGKCTEKQKSSAAKLMKAMQKDCTNEWETILKQQDPQGEHQDELKKFLEEYSS